MYQVAKFVRISLLSPVSTAPAWDGKITAHRIRIAMMTFAGIVTRVAKPL